MHPGTRPMLILLLLLFVVSTGGALPPHAHGGGCVPAERAALLSFKKAISGDPTNRLASWRGQHCCRWSGVSCSNRTSHVVKLRLRNRHPDLSYDASAGCVYDNALSGEISQSLLSLEHLEHMDFSMNCLIGPQGSMPSFLGSMKNLRYLNLSGLPFVAARVPPQLGNLSKLQYLHLGGAYYLNQTYSEDIGWLRNLPLLQHLGMSTVNLSRVADWPDVLNMLPSLRAIDLSICSLDSAAGQLLHPHFNLTKLERLDLSGNNFNHTIAPSWFWKATSLRYLNLNLNSLFGQLPDPLGNMTSLQVLALSLNHFNKIPVKTGSFGAICDLEILDLSCNWMDGDITALMEMLPQCTWGNLQELHLGYNSFTGTLPSFIGRFTSLQILDITINNIAGGIPAALGNCTYLNTLAVSDNRIVGSLPSEIRHLLSLVALCASNNSLTGRVPTGIGSLTNLTYLDLSNNDFNGVITEEHFVGLTRLKRVDLSSNNLEVVLDGNWIPPFSLEHAHFASCYMGPLFPSWLRRQPEITKLGISRTGIMQSIPIWFWSTFSNATHIDISLNQISGSLPAHLEDMALLKLNLSSNQLTGPIPMLPRNITILDISNNSFSGAIPSNFDAPELGILIISSNRFGGSIPESLCKVKNLYDLDMSSNILEGEIPQCFEFTSMLYLILSNNSLSGKFPANLKNSTNLMFLDLGRNKLSGSLPAWIGELSNLQFLRLGHNKFYGNIPIKITNLRNLRYLDLSGNNFSGVVPCHLSNLTGMTMRGYLHPFHMGSFVTVTGMDIIGSEFGETLSIITKGQQLRYGSTLAYFVSIDLSSNYFIGDIPSDITYLDALINLNLSSNRFNGKIPINIGALKSLESLDLSKNNLSGEIPSSLTILASLSYLNLSYNDLSGAIPSGRQLDTLSADNPSLMYLGNSGLCGPPVKKSCSGNNSSINGDHRSNWKELEPLSFYFGLGIGLVVGLWMVFCALLFKKTWRIAYFMLFDKLCNRVYYVWFSVKPAILTRNPAA